MVVFIFQLSLNKDKFLKPYVIEYTEDAIHFLDEVCTDAYKYRVWTEEERDTLIQFCTQLSDKFFKPMLDLEHRRLEIAKSCLSKGSTNTSDAHDEYR